jgi:hypothetical protein
MPPSRWYRRHPGGAFGLCKVLFAMGNNFGAEKM